jgi:hypothetical protein
MITLGDPPIETFEGLSAFGILNHGSQRGSDFMTCEASCLWSSAGLPDAAPLDPDQWLPLTSVRSTL